MIMIHNVQLPLSHGKETSNFFDILIDGKRVHSISPTQRRGSPHQVIDGGGRFLIPGLIDCHVHFRKQRRDLEANKQLAGLYIANGITTVYNMDGSSAILSLRRAIDQGSVIGPTIFSTSPIQDDPLLSFERAVQRMYRWNTLGYNSVKVYNNLSRAGFDGFCRSAAERNLPVVGHIVRSVGALATLSSDQSCVAHAEEFIYTHFGFSNYVPDDTEDHKLDPRKLPRLAQEAKSGGICLIATLQTSRAIMSQVADLNTWLARDEMKYLPPKIFASWQQSENEYASRNYGPGRHLANYAFQQKLVRAFHDAGVPVLAGTDTGCTGVVAGFSLVDEIMNLSACGLSRREALLAATSRTAVLTRQDSLGSIRPGGPADAVLLEADPLEDLSHLRAIVGVMHNGRWFDRRALDKLLRA